MNEWMNERTNERTNEWTKERTNERTNEWMNEWMNKRKSGWINHVLFTIYWNLNLKSRIPTDFAQFSSAKSEEGIVFLQVPCQRTKLPQTRMRRSAMTNNALRIGRSIRSIQNCFIAFRSNRLILTNTDFKLKRLEKDVSTVGNVAPFIVICKQFSQPKMLCAARQDMTTF